jgi:endonuclease YncB( thermonuclease family)
LARGARYRRLLRAFVAVLAFWLLSPPGIRAEERVKVVEIVDGDTIRVQDGREIRTVRLIGIDAPERSHPSRPKEFQADEAAGHLAFLCGGKTVLLERGDEDLDRYGRLLRYMILPPPDGRLVNKEMVRQGYARIYRRFPFSREAEFSEAEEQARKEGKGVWREGGMAEARWAREQGTPAVEVLPLGGGKFAVVCGEMAKSGVGRDDLGKTVQDVLRLRTENSDRDFESAARESGFLPLAPAGARSAAPTREPPPPPPERPLPQGIVSWDEAHRHVGQEVVVEGTLVRVHRGKKVLYFNFHPNWKKYLTVVVLGKDLRRFPKAPEAFYKGKTVRVRGKVSIYKGRPEIVIRSPGAITILK